MEHTDVLCMFQQHVLMLSRCCTDMYVVTVPNRAVQFIRDDRGCRADLEVCVCVCDLTCLRRHQQVIDIWNGRNSRHQAQPTQGLTHPRPWIG